MAKIQEVLPEESGSTEQLLEHVQNHDENNVFANERQHSEQSESINDTYVLEKDDSNVTPDSSNICTDIAKITTKRSKPDKHGHGNGIECAKAGRMLSWSTVVNHKKTKFSKHHKNL
ncbi:hypothetical protein Tco_0824226 [Tanacetum coccineum]|uniref:Uncharacterized protein n=1 Tax=Tanacetum coccineum TaxID=301880 RepID=A0ABQ5ANI9_9ASTR